MNAVSFIFKLESTFDEIVDIVINCRGKKFKLSMEVK